MQMSLYTPVPQTDDLKVYIEHYLHISCVILKAPESHILTR